jgi:hypothetical protein
LQTIIHPPSGVVKDPVRSLLSLLISLLHSVPDAELGKPSPGIHHTTIHTNPKPVLTVTPRRIII